MQDWLPYVVIGVVAAVLIAATVVFARIAWRRQVRRYIVGLMGRREAIGTALKNIEGTMRVLAQGVVADVLAFSAADSEERHAFADIAARMSIESQEIAELPLPKKLWPLAEALGAAARELADQARRVGEADGDAALDALIALDISGVQRSLGDADGYIATLSTVYDLSDPAVYGGGLYI